MRAAVRSNAPCMPQAAAEAGVTRCTKEGCRKRTCGTCGDCASHNCACNGPPSGKRETAGAPAGPRGPDTGEPPPDTDRVLRPRVEYVAGKYAEVASSEGSVAGDAGADGGAPPFDHSQTPNACLVEALRPLFVYTGIVQGNEFDESVGEAERVLERIRHFPAARMDCAFSDLGPDAQSRMLSTWLICARACAEIIMPRDANAFACAATAKFAKEYVCRCGAPRTALDSDTLHCVFADWVLRRRTQQRLTRWLRTPRAFALDLAQGPPLDQRATRGRSGAVFIRVVAHGIERDDDGARLWRG